MKLFSLNLSKIILSRWFELDVRSLLLCGMATLMTTGAIAQLPADADTLLLLRFGGSTAGVQGESPSTASGINYSPGVFGQAARFTNAASCSMRGWETSLPRKES